MLSYVFLGNNWYWKIRCNPTAPPPDRSAFLKIKFCTDGIWIGRPHKIPSRRIYMRSKNTHQRRREKKVRMKSLHCQFHMNHPVSRSPCVRGAARVVPPRSSRILGQTLRRPYGPGPTRPAHLIGGPLPVTHPKAAKRGLAGGPARANRAKTARDHTSKTCAADERAAVARRRLTNPCRRVCERSGMPRAKSRAGRRSTKLDTGMTRSSTSGSDQ